MARQLLNIPTLQVPAGIINITRYKDSTRRSLNATSDGRGEIATASFTKLKDNSTSYILVTGIVPMRGAVNYPQIGCSCTIDDIALSSGDTTISGRNGAGGGGFYYCGPPVAYEQQLGIIHKSFKEFTVGTGSHTLKVGWYASSSVRAAEWINYNSNNQARDHQAATHICIYEISR